ncbi:hypothetical protein GH714_013402 [Hevea brasiliensis]|uniref:AB hydrolase-1 domain-containing protein n=1 Tax=Hevea brasiliensis TaxID=3981 RepID=A0A6A6K4F6_HEVBR|nr:hypothetical protein GH714_013402 [Hevea brasiliensis]
MACHKVTALDLAASGVHPTQADDIHSFSEYYEPLMEFMTSLPPEEKVILVGHSMGGYSISAAMERFPEKISAGVFATAFMPGPDFSYMTLKEEDLTLATLALRPFPLRDDGGALNVVVTKEKYGSVPRIYVVCGRDNIIKEDYQRWMIDNNPTDEVKFIADSDHMVMFSKPQELCSYLHAIGKKYL